MSKDRVALYLQDAHELREGIKIVQYVKSTISLRSNLKKKS